MPKKYYSVRKYYLTIKSNSHFCRVLKFEQGDDKSFYVKWNLSLAKSKDGDYNHRSYISYHGEYNKEKNGYRVHQYGCNGEQIQESISYRGKFITEYDQEFFSYHGNKIDGGVLIELLTVEDIFFNVDSDDFDKYQVSLFSDKREDLLGNKMNKKINLVGYNLIIALFKKITK